MSLAEKARATKPRNPYGDRCAISKVMPALSQEDADALLHLVYKRLDLSGDEVGDIFAEEGIDVSAWTVRRHRADRCIGCKGRGHDGSV